MSTANITFPRLNLSFDSNRTNLSLLPLILGDRMRIPIAVQLALLVLLTAVSGVAVLAIATVESCDPNENRN
jgi:hypothetical protein